MADNVGRVPVDERRPKGIGNDLSSLQSIKVGSAASTKEKRVKYTNETKKERASSEETHKQPGTKVCKTKASYEPYQAKKSRPITTSINSDTNKSHPGEKREHKQTQYCLTVTEESYIQRGTKVFKTKANYKPYQVQKNHPVDTSSNSNINNKHSESTSTSTEENYKQRGAKVSKTKASYKPYLVKKNPVNTSANSDTNKNHSQGDRERNQTPSTLTEAYYKQQGTKDCKTKTSHEPCQVKSNHSINASSGSGINKSLYEGEGGYKRNHSPSQKRSNNTWRYDQHKSNEKYEEKTYEQKNNANYEQKKQPHNKTHSYSKQNNRRSYTNKQKQKQSRHKKSGDENFAPSNDCFNNRKKVIQDSGKIGGLHDVTNINSRRHVNEQTVNKSVSKDDTKYVYNDTELKDKPDNISKILANNEHTKIDHENEVGLPLSLSNKEPEIKYTGEVEKDQSSVEIMSLNGDIDQDIDHADVNEHNTQLNNIELPSEVDKVNKVGFSSSLQNNEPVTIIHIKEAENDKSSVKTMLQSGDTDQYIDHGNKNGRNVQLRNIESPPEVNHESRVGLVLSVQTGGSDVIHKKDDEHDKSSLTTMLQDGDIGQDIDHADKNGKNTQLHNIVSPSKKGSFTPEIHTLSIAEINIIKQIDNKRRVQGIGILECPCSLSLDGERVGFCDAHELICQI